MQKKTTKKTKPEVKKKNANKPKANLKAKRKAQPQPSKVMKAAKQIRKTTKKMVDDVILKLLGMRVLERAQEVSRSLLNEKKGKKQKS